MINDIKSEVAITRRMIGRDRLDSRVMDAMRKVPREQFVPPELRYAAFDNGPLPIGFEQTISQPYIVALMTDLLQPKEDHVVLEIGTGSGYQTAILSQLCQQVYTVEVIATLSTEAKRRFDKLGYDNIEAKTDNGYKGWPDHAPYDGIIVTAAADHVPEAFIEQLKPGGRLVIPVGLPYRYQELILIEKDNNGDTHTTSILGVAFVPLIGSTTNTDSASKPENTQ
jgi:protein-L-isoaspartate(D-aspartate) O-methyltransferase